MSKLALVVDDSMLIRHTVCRFLEDRGFRVESATNGVEALELLNGISPDIIVTDLQMPRMDGHQLISELRAKPQTSHIPIVIMSGKNHPDQPAEFASRYVIYKDIDIVAQLGRALEKLLPGSLNT
jgi:two-component system, chemotaxis family, chemotaxis protein CheY